MKVELNNVKFTAYHGLYEHERLNGGEFLVDVSIDTNDLPAYTSLEHVANYEIVYQILDKHMKTSQLFIEEVARLMSKDLIDEFLQANEIVVCVTKCAPPIPGMRGSAKATVSYTR